MPKKQNSKKYCADLIIVGAGPTGLAAALCAAKLGLNCQIIEQKQGHELASPASNGRTTLITSRSLKILGQFLDLQQIFSGAGSVESVKTWRAKWDKISPTELIKISPLDFDLGNFANIADQDINPAPAEMDAPYPQSLFKIINSVRHYLRRPRQPKIST